MALVSPRASARGYQKAPPAFYGDIATALRAALPEGDEAVDVTRLQALLWQITEWQRLSAEVINGLMDGKDNATGTLTIAINVAATTLIDRRIGPDTQVMMTPTTANAAVDLGSLFQTLPNVTRGQAVLNHASNSLTDRTFGFSLRG